MLVYLLLLLFSILSHISLCQGVPGPGDRRHGERQEPRGIIIIIVIIITTTTTTSYY